MSQNLKSISTPPNMGSKQNKSKSKKRNAKRNKMQVRLGNNLRLNQGLDQTNQKLQSILGNNPDMGCYAKTIIWPGQYFGSKYGLVPDDFANETAKYHTQVVFDIQTSNISTGSNAGRWTLGAMPRLGGLNNSSSYNVYLNEPSMDVWPFDWTQSSNYASIASGTDPRIDPNVNVLQGSPTGTGVLIGNAADTATLPMGDALSASTFSAGVVIPYEAVGVSPASTFFVPVGTWQVKAIGYLTVTVGSVVITNTFTITSGTISSMVFNPNVGISTAPVVATFEISAQAGCQLIWANFSKASGGGTVVFSGFNEVHFIRAPSNDQDNGLVKTIRPVSMSVLVSYIGDTLHDGGTISAALCPANSLATNFVVSAASATAPGLLQNWENLARIPGAYTGPLREGAYVFWKPEAQRHRDLTSPVDALALDYPMIVISGQSAASDISRANLTVARAVVTINYEYTTTSLVVETDFSTVNPDEITIAATVLSRIPSSMSNPSHEGFLSKITKWIDGATQRGGQWASNLLGPLIRQIPQGIVSMGTSVPTIKAGRQLQLQ